VLALALVALLELECVVDDPGDDVGAEEDEDEDEGEDEGDEDEDEDGDGVVPAAAAAAAAVAEATDEATSVAGESPTKNETTTMASASTISVGSNSREHTDVKPLVLALPAWLALLALPVLVLVPLLLFACACRRALLGAAPDAVVAADADADEGRFARLIIASLLLENWSRPQQTVSGCPGHDMVLLSPCGLQCRVCLISLPTKTSCSVLQTPLLVTTAFRLATVVKMTTTTTLRQTNRSAM
jgi:hypothetical protein